MQESANRTGKSPDYFIYSEDELLDSETEDGKEGGSAEAENSADRRGSVERNSTNSLTNGTPGRQKSIAEARVAQVSGEAGISGHDTGPKKRRKALPG